MCRWSPALLSMIRAGASPARRGIETDADCPATNTVSNRANAAWSVKPCWVVTTTWKPSDAAVLPPVNVAVLTGVKRGRIALLEPAHRVLTMPVITPI